MNRTMKKLEGKNEPTILAQFVLENYFFDIDYGCYEVQTHKIQPDLQYELFSWTHNSACTILTNLGFISINKKKLWYLVDVFLCL